ncbi:MAG: hypothetical protein SNJ75_06235, partial [Gemmataceae bacterium]
MQQHMKQRLDPSGTGLGLVLILGLLSGGLGLAQSPPGTPSSYRPPAGSVGSGPTGNGLRPLASTLSRQDDLLRLTRDLPGDAKPVIIEADQITTWNEGGQVVLLLEGHGLIQQSVVQGRFSRAVAFVDLPRYQTTGILHVAFPDNRL